MCNYKISNEIKALLASNEYVSFTGFYDTAFRNVQGNISTLPCTVSKNSNGYNIRTAQWNYVNDLTQNNLQFIQENYIISSYDSTINKKNGSITFNGLYPENSNTGITKPSIQRFTILGTSGIYDGVIGIIIDFNSPVRQVYFIKSKKCCHKSL